MAHIFVISHIVHSSAETQALPPTHNEESERNMVYARLYSGQWVGSLSVQVYLLPCFDFPMRSEARLTTMHVVSKLGVLICSFFAISMVVRVSCKGKPRNCLIAMC